MACDTDQHAHDGFEEAAFNDSQWQTIDVPHNWDNYHGYLRKLHGNRHGTAWYRKNFTVEKVSDNNRYFLFFEGVSSYATVWLNGKKTGVHAGGRTTFTLDITDALVFEKPNILAVRADHPANIRDLPWICGGCSDEWGFSEGSQPMGIFRPVTLIITHDVRIEPFGIHIWNDTTVSEQGTRLNISSEIKNYSDKTRSITLINSLLNSSGRKVSETITELVIGPGATRIIEDHQTTVKNPILWSPGNPYLYTLKSQILENNNIADETTTPYGIRWISWPVTRADSTKQFLVNGDPVFINGIGEYEHLFGKSHAFTEEEIRARAGQIKAAGFNAFRDAHQPHNLRYQQYWDSEGILWWPQMSAHVWFDNAAFRENYKLLLREWIKERRNSPSIIMWGLQNESVLPEEFARECVEIIRELDPTCSSQRLITTCNGGSGTDWNVIQNWSGTYGGNPYDYDKELKLQLLNGEYGAWRSIDLHTEGPFNPTGILSEDRMTQLLQTKIRQAESVRDQCCGQFLWLLSSHDNPGRIQNGEGLRDIDRIGPVNYKGLMTSWGEPLDAYYMYRADYVQKEKEPMVYIVSHTWQNRWIAAGIKDSILVYSNCDEVELFNDIQSSSLGKKKNPGRGNAFVWKKVMINYNILQATGYVSGKAVAHDIIVLGQLPEAPGLAKPAKKSGSLTASRDDYHYLYRVNCGGPDYTDHEGNTWMADRHKESDSTWGSKSWTDSFEDISPFYGSQRRTFDLIDGTLDPKLFQTFRYGLDQLSFNFPVPDGEYLVELYFTEPWYGTGGGMNCSGWRIFDVAVNQNTIIRDFDIWRESGHDKAVKKEFTVPVTGGMLIVHFPTILSGQAIISAIAIASKDKSLKPSSPSPGSINKLKFVHPANADHWEIRSWLDTGDKQHTSGDACFFDLPSLFFGAEYIKTPAYIPWPDQVMASFTVRQASDIFIALRPGFSSLPGWMKTYVLAPMTIKTSEGLVYPVYSIRVTANENIPIGGFIKNREKADNGYSIFVVPVSKLDAPGDQRPLKEYSSDLAKLSGSAGIIRRFSDRHFIELTSHSAEEIEWKFSVGLASTYAIHFRFQNNSGQPVTAEMIIQTTDGIVMHKTMLILVNQGERWQTLRTNTGASINAGDYQIKLRLSNAKGLKVERMEIR